MPEGSCAWLTVCKGNLGAGAAPAVLMAPIAMHVPANNDVTGFKNFILLSPFEVIDVDQQAHELRYIELREKCMTEQRVPKEGLSLFEVRTFNLVV